MRFNICLFKYTTTTICQVNVDWSFLCHNTDVLFLIEISTMFIQVVRGVTHDLR